MDVQDNKTGLEDTKLKMEKYFLKFVYINEKIDINLIFGLTVDSRVRTKPTICGLKHRASYADSDPDGNLL